MTSGAPDSGKLEPSYQIEQKCPALKNGLTYYSYVNINLKHLAPVTKKIQAEKKI
jgi:hypothetical protein